MSFDVRQKMCISSRISHLCSTRLFPLNNRLTFKGRVYTCDAIYHGAGFLLPNSTPLQQVSYRLVDNDLVSLVHLDFQVDIDHTEFEFLQETGSGVGTALIMDGHPSSEAISEDIVSRIFGGELSHLDPTSIRVSVETIGSLRAVVINSGWGTSPFDVYRCRSGFVLDFTNAKDLNDEEWRDSTE